MKFVGAHVSASGGVENAPLNAAAIGAKAFALFTKNQRQWFASELTEKNITEFKKNCADLNYSGDKILAHDSYLINLGNADDTKRKQSLDSFIGEAKRCQQLGIKLLNFHPGSHLKLISENDCLKLIADGVKVALAEVPDVTLVIENTAGQGSNVGYSFEHLARLLEYIGDTDRVGICIDTCHAYAAGYDLKTPENYDWTFREFERLIGIKYLKGMHLNDSKGTLGKHLDRHHSIGEGELGFQVFERIMQDERFDNIPLILETIDESKWAEEIKLLYSYQK
ncbi:MAG: deoxyribonuclease IV [Lentisphaeria bacterium]|nr:deoxyribonuclease IV [Lentisphaeria bacterium]